MKKLPVKVLSSAAVFSLLAVSPVAPFVTSADAATNEIADGIYISNGENSKYYSLSEFFTHQEEIIAAMNAAGPQNVYLAQDNKANNAYNLALGGEELKDYEPGLIPAADYVDTSGESVEIPQEPIVTEFEVTDIAAINETGVTVTFPSSEQDLTNVTVEVKDPEGTVVPVKAIETIAAGETSATFEFETALETVTPGEWTVNGVTYKVLSEEEIAAAEQKAIDLINSSTVYNIVERLQAPVLALEGVNPEYATEYQAAREANFTSTKEQIQKNVIDHVQALKDAEEAENQEAIAGIVEDINEAVTAYKNAKNEGEQNTATTNMATALLALQNDHGLTTYTADNNVAYMQAFVSAGTEADFAQVQSIVQAVNGAVELDAQVEEATNAVEALTDAEGALAADQGEIDAAQVLVTALPDGETKTALQTAINIAQQLLDEANLADQAEEATNAVEALTDGNALAIDVDQDDIDAAQVLVDALAETGYDVADLNAAIHVAQILLNTEEATAAVYSLFTDGTVAVDALVLEEGVAQEDITDAKALVTALPKEVNVRAELLVKVDKAQELYTASEEEVNEQALEAATTTVNALFVNVEAVELELDSLVDQAAVTAAKEAVEALVDSAEKEALLAKVQVAQGLLDTAALNEATAAVEALVDTEGALVGDAGTAQANINEAQDLVSALPDSEDKDELQAKVDHAKELLFVRDANLINGEGNFRDHLLTLSYAPFTDLGAVKSTEVAKLVIINRPAEGFTSISEIKTAVDTAIAQYNSLLADVNAADTISEMQKALQAIATANGGDITITVAEAEAALVNKPEAGYKSITAVLTVITP